MLTIQRLDPNDGLLKEYRGVDAVSLTEQQVIVDANGIEIIPHSKAGSRVLLEKLLELYFLDDQDLAWSSLDKFFCYSRPHSTDFPSYVQEWERLYEDAVRFGGLNVNDIGKCWLFFSRSGLPDRQLQDLRLKVNGDMTRFSEMVRLQLKLSKNDEAAMDQGQGYRHSGYYDSDYNYFYYDALTECERCIEYETGHVYVFDDY